MSRLAATLAAAVLGITGVVALGVAMASQNPAPPTAPAASAEGRSPVSMRFPPTPEPEAGDRPNEAPPLPESRPVRLRIPAIGVTAGFVDLGVARDGTLQVPDEAAQVGWFTGAHTPGAPGVAVFAGHVTRDDKPAVFFRLADLRPGDRIQVARADGSIAVFSVQRVASFPKTEFPTAPVYRPTDRPVLRLITCGGAFDTSTQHYVDNTIAWAKLVRAEPANPDRSTLGTIE